MKYLHASVAQKLKQVFRKKTKINTSFVKESDKDKSGIIFFKKVIFTIRFDQFLLVLLHIQILILYTSMSYRFIFHLHIQLHTRFFYKQCFFSIQPQCCFTFSWTKLQMLLRCCLIDITIIIVRHILYLLYLCPCLDLGQFISFLCDQLAQP